MLKGKIVFYDKEKHRGYIRLVDTLEEFHFRTSDSEAKAGFEAGAWVQFKLKQDRHGCHAIDVAPLLLA